MKILKWLTEQIPDIIILTGIILLAIGLYKIYPPSSFVIIGVLLIYTGTPKKKVK